MWLLFSACSPPPPPALALPPLLAAENAESIGVDRFLAATELGAKDGLLCPWFLGEPVPDASLARWTAEERLTWLVLEVSPRGTRLADELDIARVAKEYERARKTLADRCGGTRELHVLAVVDADATTGALVEPVRAAIGANVDGFWLAVDDPSPAPAAAVGDGNGVIMAIRGASAVGLFDRAGNPWDDSAARPAAPLDVDASRVAAFVTDQRPACAYVAAQPRSDFAGTLALLDTLLGAGAPRVAISGIAPPEGAPSSGDTAGARGDGERRERPVVQTIPLHGELAAIPLGVDRSGGPCATGSRTGPRAGHLAAP